MSDPHDPRRPATDTAAAADAARLAGATGGRGASARSRDSNPSTVSSANPGPGTGTAHRGRRPDPRHQLGAEGEERAAAYLARRGYRIVARNVRGDGVEIDLIARRAGTLAFVEVKTRRGQRHGSPAEAVDFRKQARIARGAAAWLHEERPRVRRIRFDVVSCWKEGRLWRIEHWPGAFDAP